MTHFSAPVLKIKKKKQTARLAIRPTNYPANSTANALASELAYLVYVTPVLKIRFMSSDGSIRLNMALYHTCTLNS